VSGSLFDLEAPRRKLRRLAAAKPNRLDALMAKSWTTPANSQSSDTSSPADEEEHLARHRGDSSAAALRQRVEQRARYRVWGRG
jgi:hypothetical protein